VHSGYGRKNKFDVTWIGESVSEITGQVVKLAIKFSKTLIKSGRE